MIGFLNNILLPFFATVALPLIIHLLTRHRRDKLQFSSLQFLRKIQEKKIKRIRLKQILLLILRTLTIFCIVAAFTRPTIKGYREVNSSGHDPTSVIIIIDRSYSVSSNTDGVSMLTRIREAAHEISEMLQAGDDFNVILFDSETQKSLPAQSRLVSDLPSIIDTISYVHRGTDLISAIELAAKEMEKSRAANKEIYVLVDKSGGGLSGVTEITLPDDTRLFIFPFDRSSDPNAGISEIEFPGKLIEVGRTIELSAQLENFSEIPYGQLSISLFVDDVRVSQGGTELATGESKKINLAANVGRGGFHSGYFELPGDLIPVDNKRYFTFRVPQKLDVLLIGNRGTSELVKLALQAGAESYFDIEQKAFEQLSTEYLKERDVVIVDGLRSLPKAFLSRLENFVQAGGGLLILGSDSKNPEKALNSLSGVEFVGEFASNDAFLSFGKGDFTHPILVMFDNEIPEIQFTSVSQLSRDSGAFLYFSNGSPAIIDRKLGDGRIVLTAFSTDNKFSGILTSGFFLPFLHRSVQYLAGDEARFDEDFLVGQDIVRQIEDFPQGAKLIIDIPEGSRQFLIPRFSMGKAVYSIDAIEKAGVYKVYADSVLVDIFSVNVDSRESAHSSISEELLTFFPDAKIADQENIRSTILNARYGRELWKFFLIAALIFLMLELLLETSWKKLEIKSINTDFK